MVHMDMVVLDLGLIQTIFLKSFLEGALVELVTINISSVAPPIVVSNYASHWRTRIRVATITSNSLALSCVVNARVLGLPTPRMLLPAVAVLALAAKLFTVSLAPEWSNKCGLSVMPAVVRERLLKANALPAKVIRWNGSMKNWI